MSPICELSNTSPLSWAETPIAPRQGLAACPGAGTSQREPPYADLPRGSISPTPGCVGRLFVLKEVAAMRGGQAVCCQPHKLETWVRVPPPPVCEGR